jgi:hypothetical protein
MGKHRRHTAFIANPSSPESLKGMRPPSAVAPYARKVGELSLSLIPRSIVSSASQIAIDLILRNKNKIK